MFVKLKKNLIAGLVLAGSVALCVPAMAAASLTKSGVEYPVFPSLPLDQVVPHLSLGPGGGYLVAQDTVVDGNGLGIRARRVNPDLSMALSTFAVNSFTAGDQQNAKVAMLPNGGAVFVWQGSTGRGNKIYARFMGPDQRFLSAEISGSDRMFGHQSDAAVAVLKDGTVVIVWSELKREPAPDDRMQGVFAQRFTSTGERLGASFRVNTVTYLNQRTPAIVALANGGFVVAWVSDEFRFRDSEYIDIAARLFDAEGNALGEDFALNSKAEICANPALVATADGFRAAWSSRAVGIQVVSSQGMPSAGVISTQVVSSVDGAAADQWEVSARSFNLQGQPFAPEIIINETHAGNQYSPRLISFGSGDLALWTSVGQDGSFEGIVGRVIRSAGEFDGGEFVVNSRTAFGQMFPAAAALGDKVLVAWTSFISVNKGFDLLAQQFTVSADEALQKPVAPFAFALGADTIAVSWAEIGAQPIAAYRIHVDSETTPMETTQGMLKITRSEWLPASAHTLRISYRLEDGRISPLSDPVSVTTWGADLKGEKGSPEPDGLPDDWQRENWGKEANWPLANADADADGASNLTEFLAGTDPTDAASVLKVEISVRQQGLYVQWPTTPGNYYQLQYTSDFNGWTNIGAARFAPSASDALPVTGSGQVQYYRLIRMR